MSEVEHKVDATNTPVQTPSSESYFEKQNHTSAKDADISQDPEKPLSPPNPSPSPVKRKLSDTEDNELESELKKPKTEGSTESTEVSKDDTSETVTSEILATTDSKAEVPTPIQMPSEPAPKPPAEPDMDNLPENPMPKHQCKYILNAIKAIKRLKDAAPFLHPVDIVKLNIPFYYNFIKRPMDLSTIEKKLTVEAYEDPQQVIDDFNLMVDNCIKFNGETSGISRMAKNIQAHFEKHTLSMPPKVLPVKEVPVVAQTPTPTSNSRSRTTGSKTSSSTSNDKERRESVAGHRPKRTIHPPKSKELPYDVRPRKKKFAAELRFCNQTIKELMSKKHYNINFPFLAPVDTVALNIPNYSDIVKVPMDLGTIQTKLANNQYEDGNEFEKDVKLVFKNCYAFNPPGTDVHIMGKKLEAVFDKKWANKPVPEPTPPPTEVESSSSEEEEEIDESVLSSVPAIQVLENQLIRMKQEIDRLKKEHLKKLREQRDARIKKKRANKKKNGRRGSGSNNGGAGSSSNQHVKEIPIVTYEMKKQVSETVPGLSDKKLQALIKIIKDDIDISNEEEVELDMDQIEDRTVLKLYNFLFGKKAALANKKKKKQPIPGGADEMEQLRSQLALFEENQGVSSHMKVINDEESSSGEEDDASSESSEEE